MSFGEYLKKLRCEKSISQRRLALLTGISNAEISRLETGERRKPSPHTLMALSPVLEVSFKVLMEEAGYMGCTEQLSKMADVDDEFIHTVTPILIKKGWNVELCKYPALGDILARKDSREWFISYKSLIDGNCRVRNCTGEMAYRPIIEQIFGKAAMYKSPNLWKLTIATNSEITFRQLEEYIPYRLNMKVSVMLVDYGNHSIINEKQLV